MRNHNGLTTREPRLYNIWVGMIHRCENQERDGYEKYGARGVSVCDEWHDFEAFVEWARCNGYDDSLTIDRINVNGNYEPSNCRWADTKTQANNKRTSVVLNVGGIEGTVKQWANLIGVSQYTLYDYRRTHGIEETQKRVLDAIRNGKFEKNPTVKHNCEKCGREYETLSTAANTKYCDECKVIAGREKSLRYYYRKQKENCGARVKEGE